MQKEYTINGKVYRLVEEEKKPERLTVWAFNDVYSPIKFSDGCVKCVAVKHDEILVSREDVRKVLERYDGDTTRIMKELGFK